MEQKENNTARILFGIEYTEDEECMIEQIKRASCRYIKNLK